MTKSGRMERKNSGRIERKNSGRIAEEWRGRKHLERCRRRRWQKTPVREREK